MSGHRRRRHALGQPEASGVNVEMAPDGMRRRGPQQLPIPDQVADRHRLEPERLRNPSALAPTVFGSPQGVLLAAARPLLRLTLSKPGSGSNRDSA